MTKKSTKRKLDLHTATVKPKLVPKKQVKSQLPFQIQQIIDFLKYLLFSNVGIFLTIVGFMGLGIFLFYPFGRSITLGQGPGETIQNNVILIFFAYVAFFAGVILLSKSLNKKFQNLRIVLLIILMSGVLFMGLGAIDTIFPYAPLTMVKTQEGVSVSCSSFDKNAVPVVEDVLVCNLSYSNLCSLKGKMFLSVTVNNETRGNGDRVFYDDVCKDNALVFNDARKQINREGRNIVVFQLFNLSSQNPMYSDRQIFLEYKSLSQDAYDTRNNNRLQALILLVTLAVFSTIAAVRDFLEIWDGVGKKKE